MSGAKKTEECRWAAKARQCRSRAELERVAIEAGMAGNFDLMNAIEVALLPDGHIGLLGLASSGLSRLVATVEAVNASDLCEYCAGEGQAHFGNGNQVDCLECDGHGTGDPERSLDEIDSNRVTWLHEHDAPDESGRCPTNIGQLEVLTKDSAEQYLKRLDVWHLAVEIGGPWRAAA